MLDVQVDEFTLVLQPTKRPNYMEKWDIMAINIIEEFLKLSQIEVVFEELKQSTSSLPMGYSKGLVSEDVPYYFAIAYHPSFIQMGVCIKFSAHAWAQYREKYRTNLNQDMEIHQFLQTVSNTNLYTSRMSRIDIAIDFINEKVNVNTIYKQLSRKNQHVRNATGRKNNSTLSAVTKNDITSTFYLGSKVKNNKALLRVYDKKLEQLETFGYQYQEAITYDNWVRFETSYKGKYAHSLSDELKVIKNDSELKNLLVSALVDRYQFYYTKSNRITTYSKKMLDLLDKKDFQFISPSPRTNLLEQSQKHILTGSGLFPYLYKVHKVWGDEGLSKCLEFLYDEYENYVPNDDVTLWLNRYSEIYKQQGYPFKRSS